MRVSPLILVVSSVTLSQVAIEGFVSPSTFALKSQATSIRVTSDNSGLHEFDHLLQETNEIALEKAPSFTRRVVVPAESAKEIRMTASTVPTSFVDDAMTSYDETSSVGTYAGQKEFSDTDIEMVGETTLEKYQAFEERNSLVKNVQTWWKDANAQDIAWTVFLPGLLMFWAGRTVFKRVSGEVQGNTEQLLADFTSEMLYHDGDFEELKFCFKDYSTKLVFLGPRRNDVMLKRYLEEYARRLTISPRAISSMSYVLSLFGLNEQKAGKTFLNLAKTLGTENVSTVAKLYFFGTRLLKSQEGKDSLRPMKDMMISSYRTDDNDVGDEMVDAAQQAMAEAAYRSVVQEAGKEQTKKPVGWEILGVSEDMAQLIFEEEKEQGFVTMREAMYDGQLYEYTKKGKRIGEGDDEEDDDDDDEEQLRPGQALECSNCGFTLFIAAGRDKKFYGPDFKCPECGADRDQMKVRNMGED